MSVLEIRFFLMTFRRISCRCDTTPFDKIQNSAHTHSGNAWESQP